MLACTLTFRDSKLRTDPLPSAFTLKNGVDTMIDVLLHEARETMEQPLAAVPENAYLTPVDVDTDEPGIIASKTVTDIIRMDPNIPRVSYRAQRIGCDDTSTEEEPYPLIDLSHDKAIELAQKNEKKLLRREERKAQTAKQIGRAHV